jgi:hypothetical protein
MDRIDIAPFALPNTPPGTYIFEELRDISAIELADRKGVRPEVFYLQRTWPEGMWYGGTEHIDDPARFGWIPTDDHFNGEWRRAEVVYADTDSGTLVSFKPLEEEGWELSEERRGVRFRRTLGIRLSPDSGQAVVHTTSASLEIAIRAELGAGGDTEVKTVGVSAYNSLIRNITSVECCAVSGTDVVLHDRGAVFQIQLSAMSPEHSYAGDDGLVTFDLQDRKFTISLRDILEGQVWFKDAGILVTRADTEERASIDDLAGDSSKARTVSQTISSMPEQSFAGAFYGQPRPHAVLAHTGVKHSRQRFLIEPNCDVVLDGRCLWEIEGGTDPAGRFAGAGNDGPYPDNGRFFFGMERWICRGRFRDSSHAPIFNINHRKDTILSEYRVFAAPLLRGPEEHPISCDEPISALVRFHFHNDGNQSATVELPIAYSTDSSRSVNALSFQETQDDYLVPQSPKEHLSVGDGIITGSYRSTTLVRCAYESTMESTADGDGGVLFAQNLEPGADCELVLKIPFLAPDDDERRGLQDLSYEKCLADSRRFWSKELSTGAQVRTPVPHLNDLHTTHLSHVQISDFTMPNNPDLINTSVGTSTYGNFSNESCMIVQEMTQRGLFSEARRRLELWIHYQGTVSQPGNFTDYQGMYFGAGGFEQGNYNQHHGWVLWCIAEHFFLTGDREWFESAAASVLAACDWVFRQRKTTRDSLAHSRGWEAGFLPAGSLEDVEDFHYWLSTNALTWRAVDHAGRALEAVGHPDARRVRAESDAYRIDLIRGFDTTRDSSPLVGLRDGSWVPHYPSRLYRRGRDYGWIREVLEGSVYLLISGLYSSDSEEAGWILDDFQDNRYLSPPNGYLLRDIPKLLKPRGGFSIQPTLLAGLLPYLERDEPEMYIWMFFNAFCACYREEIEGFSEHPMPELGFSNSAEFKTSDEANACMWLRYLFVYWNSDTLHIGRATPREWLGVRGNWGVTDLATYHGKLDVTYVPDPANHTITCQVNRREPRGAPRTLARFRHPEKKGIVQVSVNGTPWDRFDSEANDVDITGLEGSVKIVASFA